MLLELRIENLLVIERAELRFGAGLNAITGETGAGKTVLAHSLDLLMGGRARAQIVRPGATEAYVEGVFELPPDLLDDPQLSELAERFPEGAEEVVLGRRVGASGRTSAFVAGRSASATDLQQLGRRLLAFFGQHEHRRLTLGAAQLDVLDGFIGPDQLELRSVYRDAHARVLALSSELNKLQNRDGARARDLDLLRYELAEIDEAAPNQEEEELLEADRSRLRNAEGLRQATAGALAAIAGAEGEEGGAQAALAHAEASLGSLAGVDRGLDELAARVSSLALEAADVIAELRSSLEQADGDPGLLESIEERLDLLARLKRKHGGSVEAVLSHAEHCRLEIERLEGAQERGEEIEADLCAASQERMRLAQTLSEARAKAAPELESRAASELSQLAMDGASLEVVLEPHPAGIGASGAERIELRVSTNPGMPSGPLKDAASGGELSRLMLALSGLSGGGSAPTIVFDEVDAGIGGATARAVGERLRDLAGDRQLLCITHLPQIAALADTHFSVSKQVSDGVTATEVNRIEGAQLVAEITRMLGGRGGDAAASRHAQELLAA